MKATTKEQEMEKEEILKKDIQDSQEGHPGVHGDRRAARQGDCRARRGHLRLDRRHECRHQGVRDGD
eukprot:3507980-Heterocapsa_arctica.AAC.1